MEKRLLSVKKYLNVLLVFFIFFKVNILFANTAENLQSKKFILIVQKVIPQSVAETVGLLENDILYAINDRIFYDINSPTLATDFITYLKSLPSGSFNIDIIRNGEKHRFKVNLSDQVMSPRLEIVVEQIENNPQIYFDKALSLLKQTSSRDDLKKVASLFERAKILSPEWADVYYNLGLIYEKLDFYDKAVDNLVRYMQFMIRKNAPFEEVNKIAELVGRLKKKQEKLDSIKVKMVEGKWTQIKRIPQSKLAGSFGTGAPTFRFDKSGKMWMKNTLSEVKLTGDHPQVILARKNLSENPWFPVNFDGRYFEIKWAEVYQSLQIEAGNRKPYLSPRFCLVQGEIDLDSPSPTITMRTYHNSPPLFYNNNFDEAIELAKRDLQKFNFNLYEHFSYEYLFRIE